LDWRRATRSCHSRYKTDQLAVSLTSLRGHWPRGWTPD
jgi:hypothetical protein